MMNWTRYNNLTKKETKQLFKIVDTLIQGKQQSKQESPEYKNALRILKQHFHHDAQDFIEYYSL